MTNKASYTLNAVHNISYHDGNIFDVTKKRMTEEEREAIVEARRKVEQEAKKRAEEAFKEESDEEWGLKNLKEIITTSKEGKALDILNFFKNFVQGGVKYGHTSKDDIINGCGITTFNHFTLWKKNGGQYKLLVPVEKNEYRINPQVIELF